MSLLNKIFGINKKAQGQYGGADTKQKYEPMANVEHSDTDASREDEYPGVPKMYPQNTGTDGIIHDRQMANLNVMAGTEDLIAVNRPDKNKEKAEGTKFAQKLANY